MRNIEKQSRKIEECVSKINTQLNIKKYQDLNKWNNRKPVDDSVIHNSIKGIVRKMIRGETSVRVVGLINMLEKLNVQEMTMLSLADLLLCLTEIDMEDNDRLTIELNKGGRK